MGNQVQKVHLSKDQVNILNYDDIVNCSCNQFEVADSNVDEVNTETNITDKRGGEDDFIDIE